MKQLEGTLSHWDPVSGTGIITPLEGDRRFAVTLADFPPGRIKPRLGEELLFQADTDDDGRPRAREVTRPAHAMPPPLDEMPEYLPPRISRHGSTGVLPLILWLAIAGLGYLGFTTPPEQAPAALQQPLRSAQATGKLWLAKLQTLIRQL